METLYVRYADGREQPVFQPVESGSFNFGEGLAWSPDGRHLVAGVYSSAAGYQLWAMEPDGSDLRVLWTDDRSPCVNPLWSPDGRRLACVAGRRDSLTRTLEVIDAAKGSVTEVARFEHDPAGGSRYRWSPDSQLLLYLAGRYANDDSWARDELWAVRRDGSDGRRLLTRAAMPHMPTGIGGFLWSPTSDAVAFGNRNRLGPVISIVQLGGELDEVEMPRGPQRPGAGSSELQKLAYVEVVAWTDPDDMLFRGADYSAWWFVATIAHDGTLGDMVLDWDTRAWVGGELWTSSDGQALYWWERTTETAAAPRACLRAAVRGDLQPRTEFCIDDAVRAIAVGQAPINGME
jgi:hypothetical protein